VERKSIIWNVTRACPWNCKFCCTASTYISHFKQINNKRCLDYKFENELRYSDKVKIIDQMYKGDFRIDFSGGELFIDPLNADLILYASEKLGKNNIGVSASGAFVTDDLVRNLRDKINEFEITLDYTPFHYYESRPIGYHEYAQNAIFKLKENGIRVGIQTVLTIDNIDRQSLYTLLQWSESFGVDEWSLLRFFPVGRGSKHSQLTPSYSQYCNAVDYLKSISKDSKVDTHFQYLLPNHSGYTLKCRAVKKSIGILPSGLVVGCFWCLDENMYPKTEDFLENKISELVLT
jgi:MoaA/NifB/PqqE/SkfB family radical SAM enzyme